MSRVHEMAEWLLVHGSRGERHHICNVADLSTPTDLSNESRAYFPMYSGGHSPGKLSSAADDGTN